MHSKLGLSRATFVVGLVVVCSFVWAGWAAFTLATGPVRWSGWRIGEPVATAAALSTADAGVVRQRTHRLLGAFGIRPVRSDVVRSLDRRLQRRIDEVTALGAEGKPIATVDWDARSGRLETLTRYLRDVSVPGSSLDRSDVAGVARDLLGRAGIAEPPGLPVVSWDQGMGSWQALWTRRIDGVPAPEDVISVWVLPDGGLRALSDLSGDGAVTPGVLISPADASTAVLRFLERTATGRPVELGEARLEWVHPNGFTDPTLPDSPDPGIRLVYVIPYAIGLPGGDSAQGMLWVDARSGALVGGGAIS